MINHRHLTHSESIHGPYGKRVEIYKLLTKGLYGFYDTFYTSTMVANYTFIERVAHFVSASANFHEIIDNKEAVSGV